MNGESRLRCLSSYTFCGLSSLPSSSSVSEIASVVIVETAPAYTNFSGSLLPRPSPRPGDFEPRAPFSPPLACIAGQCQWPQATSPEFFISLHSCSAAVAQLFFWPLALLHNSHKKILGVGRGGGAREWAHQNRDRTLPRRASATAAGGPNIFSLYQLSSHHLFRKMQLL